MANQLKSLGLNIDYFPDNFVVSDNTLYYVDYEHNVYDEAWNLINWGIYYWANSQGIKEYRRIKDPISINQHADSGIPIKAPFEDIVTSWIRAHDR